MPKSSEMTVVSDEDIIKATLRGETACFGTIVERYWNMVVALALSRVADPAEAEDIAQESFLKAYSQLPGLRNPLRFAGWLSKITLQQCSNTIRFKTRHAKSIGCKATSVEDLYDEPTQIRNPGLTQDQTHFVRRAVSRLPEKFRTLIIMRFVAGLSTVQIAEQLGGRPGAIRVRLHRAYKILREDLAPVLEEVE